MVIRADHDYQPLTEAQLIEESDKSSGVLKVLDGSDKIGFRTTAGRMARGGSLACLVHDDVGVRGDAGNVALQRRGMTLQRGGVILAEID